MSFVKLIGCLTVALCTITTVAPAQAQGGSAEAQELMFLQFSGPVRLPGATLAPGRYMFKRVNHENPDVFQISNEQGTQHYGIWLMVRATRTEPTAEPEVRFIETPAGTPSAIRSWFYPQRRMGHEFVYSKEQALMLAKTSGESVLMRDSNSTDVADLERTPVQSVSPTGEITPYTESADAAAAREPETQMARAEAAPPAAAETQTVGTSGQAAPPAAPARAALPKTASSLWLVGLIGLLSLGGALSTRALARVRA